MPSPCPKTSRSLACGLLLLMAFTPLTASAGEIAGLPPQLPPFREPVLDVAFSNDFFGRGGSVDDFRTQQLILSAGLSERWIGVLDHSILTFSDMPSPGRIDQLSASLGYRVVDSVSEHFVNKVVIGTGIRQVGRLGGERIQNGFHRLVGSEIEDLSYSGDDNIDLTGWFDAQHYRNLYAAGSGGVLNSWHRGYWLKASALATSGGQWDSSAGLFAVASKGALDAWFGLRRDWRSGYKDNVLRQTAAAEDDVAIVLGVRFGALVLETVQQLNNDASYGQLRFVSSGKRGAMPETRNHRFGVEAAILMPNVQLRFAGRLQTRIFTNTDSRWYESTIFAASYGEPQYGNQTNLFVRSQQLEFGTDLEHPLAARGGWLSAYLSTSAGWRTEELINVNFTAEQKSGSVGRAVLSVGTGLRIAAANLGDDGSYRIQLGLTGRLPIGDANLEIDDVVFRVQKPALEIQLGMTFDFR
jgi:hypothetical protein